MRGVAGVHQRADLAGRSRSRTSARHSQSSARRRIRWARRWFLPKARARPIITMANVKTTKLRFNLICPLPRVAD